MPGAHLQADDQGIRDGWKENGDCMEAIIINMRDMDLSLMNDGLNDHEKEDFFYANVTPECVHAEEKMWDAYQWRDKVTLRYPLIDVSGIISKVRYDLSGKVFTLKIDDLVHRKQAGDGIQNALSA